MKENKDKKIKIATAAYSFLGLVLILILLFGAAIYGFGANNQLTQKAARIFPFPAAVIGGVNFISLSSLEKNLSAVRQFYENQDFESVGMKVDFNSEDGQKRLDIREKDLLTRMIENRIIEILANQRGIVLSKEAVSQEVAKRIAQLGSQDELVKNLQKLYGWNVADFEEKIVKPDMYRNLLAESAKKEDSSGEQARKKIEKAAADLGAKKDFGETAKAYSDGDSARNGGELGWFAADQMLPELAVPAFGLEKGKISDIVASSLGYHIIQVEDKKAENGVDKVKIRQIFVRTKNFSDWLLEQEKNIKIYVPLKGMYWNSGDGAVEFSDKSMRQLEETLSENQSNDPSILF